MERNYRVSEFLQMAPFRAVDAKGRTRLRAPLHALVTLDSTAPDQHCGVCWTDGTINADEARCRFSRHRRGRAVQR